MEKNTDRHMKKRETVQRLKEKLIADNNIHNTSIACSTYAAQAGEVQARRGLFSIPAVHL